MDKATVVIIDHSQGISIKERLKKCVEVTVMGSTDNPDIGLTLAERFQPAIIILNVDLPGGRGPSLAETLALEFPMSSLILLSNSDSKKVLHLALEVGAKQVITLPVDDDKLIRSVQKVVQGHWKRQALYSVQKNQKPQFKTITVFSTKGGVGKTTVALNLALAIREITGKRVVAVDLDLLSGNLSLMAGVSWKHSIKDLVDDINTLDKELIDSYCAEHPSGLKILSAPLHPDFVGFVQPEHVQKVLSLMSSVFNYVVVDAPTYLHDTVVPALEAADDIIVVTTLDLASIQNLKQCIDLLARLSMRTKARIVVNRMGYSGGLKVKDVEDEIGMAVECIIPNQEKAAIDAVNMGKPLFTSARNSQVARRFAGLAAKVLAEEDRHGLAGVPVKLSGSIRSLLPKSARQQPFSSIPRL